MKYVVTLNDKNYEVEISRGDANIVGVSAVGAPAPASVSAPAPAAVSAPAQVSAAPAQPGAGEPILAPMPGTIVNVKVSAGESVKKGIPLLVLEAMKMENDIVAPRDGVVTSVAVDSGAAVNPGDLLLTLS